MPADLPILTSLLPRVTAAGSSASTTVGELAQPVDFVDADLPFDRLEAAFRSPHLRCVAVQDHRDGGIGLVTRRRFLAEMIGPLGFGRALMTRSATRHLTDWSPLIADARSTVLEVALTAMNRPADRRYDEVLVSSATWGVVSPADFVHALSKRVAVSTLHDPLTSLPARALLLHRLRLLCHVARSTRARVGVVQLDVMGFGALNTEHGHIRADALLTAMAARLRRATPKGFEVGRTGNDEFTVIGSISGDLDDRDTEIKLESVRSTLIEAAGAIRSPSGNDDVALRSACTVSPPGGADPDDLFWTVQTRLRAGDQSLAVTAVR